MAMRASEWTDMDVARRNDDLDMLRNRLRACLRPDTRKGSSALADMQTRSAKGEQKLKPSKAPWTQVAHATATINTGSSRPNITDEDFTDSRLVKAIWGLHTKHIQSIMSHYSPSSDLRNNSSRHLSAHIAGLFREKVTRGRAKVIAQALLANPWTERRLYESFGMTYEQWRSSQHRRTATEVKAAIHRLDVESVNAWASACGEL